VSHEPRMRAYTQIQGPTAGMAVTSIAIICPAVHIYPGAIAPNRHIASAVYHGRMSCGTSEHALPCFQHLMCHVCGRLVLS